MSARIVRNEFSIQIHNFVLLSVSTMCATVLCTHNKDTRLSKDWLLGQNIVL
jgi:hypothetical protein